MLVSETHDYAVIHVQTVSLQLRTNDTNLTSPLRNGHLGD